MSKNDHRKAEAILRARWIVRLMNDPLHQVLELSVRDFQSLLAHDYGVQWSTRTISEAKEKAKERLPYGFSKAWTPPQYNPPHKRDWLTVRELGDMPSIPATPDACLLPLPIDEDGHWLEDEDEQDTSSWFMIPRPVSHQG